MIRRWLTVTALVSLTGCTAFFATSQDLYYHDEVFLPRRTPHAVALYEVDRPQRDYVVLGRIVATQGLFGSRQSVLDELRRKAATLGADAVVDLVDENRRSDGTASSERTRYSQSGNVSTSESWDRQSGPSIRLTLSGLAVRFRDP